MGVSGGGIVAAMNVKRKGNKIRITQHRGFERKLMKGTCEYEEVSHSKVGGKSTAGLHFDVLTK